MEVIGALIANIGILSMIFLILGVSLVIVEMFIPGFGFPGVTGGILIFLGIILTAQTLMEAFILFIFILAILGIAFAFILYSSTKGHLSKNVILSTSMTKEKGYSGTENMEQFLDKEGIAVTNLRPSGVVDFNGVKLDVVTEGEYIGKNAKVTVIKVAGRRIVVRDL